MNLPEGFDTGAKAYSSGQLPERIKVLWILKAIGPGGAETLLLEAAKQHDRTQYELHMAAQCVEVETFAEQFRIAGVRVHLLDPKRQRMAGAVAALPRLIRTLRPHIVHVHSPALGSLARLASLVIRPRPILITTEHNTWGSYRLSTRFANALTCQLDRRLLAVSSEALRSVRGPIRKRSERLVHGIDVTAIQQDHSGGIAHRTSGECPHHGPFRIINVGHLRDQKDHATLLRSLSRLRERSVEFECRIVGSGPLRDQLESLAAEMGLSHRVTFLGTRTDVLDLMDDSDLMAMSSAWEGLPLVMMEALSLALPIVSTAVGGVQEELAGSAAAVLCAPCDPEALADSLQAVAVDAELRRTMSQRALVEAERFRSSRAVDAIEAVYSHELMHRGRSYR